MCVTTLQKLKRTIKKAYTKKTFSCNHLSFLSSNEVQKSYLEIWHNIKRKNEKQFYTTATQIYKFYKLFSKGLRELSQMINVQKTDK